MKTKAKINKQDLIKLKRFCTAKDIINKTKTMEENICKWSNRPGINLQTIQTAHVAQYFKKKTKHLNQNIGGRPKWYFSKDIQIANKYMERCSTPPDSQYPNQLYSFQLKMEKLRMISKNTIKSWLCLTSWTSYCKIEAQIEENRENH